MYLSLLSREEKFYFIDLLTKTVKVGGEMTDTEKQIVDKLKYEMGEDAFRYRRSLLSMEKLVEYFSKKSRSTKNLVYLNLVSVSLLDEFYSVEDHFLLEDIQKAFDISDKKKAELMKIVYAERDLREKARRIISE